MRTYLNSPELGAVCGLDIVLLVLVIFDKLMLSKPRGS